MSHHTCLSEPGSKVIRIHLLDTITGGYHTEAKEPVLTVALPVDHAPIWPSHDIYCSGDHFGLTTHQTYRYYRLYPTDTIGMKTLVRFVVYCLPTSADLMAGSDAIFRRVECACGPN